MTIKPEEADALPLLANELDLLAELLLDARPATGPLRLLEAGCGNARLARQLLERYPQAELTSLEVDERQLAKNIAEPAQPRLHFIRAGAEAIPLPDASIDGALMLKSLHHVPLDAMDRALDELARVLKPGGWLYVSEPIYAGALNEIVRLYNDEGTVRAAAQRALDTALARADSRWQTGPERRFASAVRFKDFAEFEQRMMRPTFADHHIDEAKLAHVGAAYAPHQRLDGARFVRPMHVRVLMRKAR
jgi:ubiquinone/menaquinone biosynthesis C-methylase UbiE